MSARDPRGVSQYHKNPLTKWRDFWFSIGPALALVVFLQALSGTRYGLFRDELYYLACAQRLDWSYVDHPGLSVWLLRGVTEVFGDSEIVVRSLSGVGGLLSVVMMGWLTRRLGGNGWAIAIAAAVIAAAPVFRAIGLFFSPNTFELSFWILCIVAWQECLKPKAEFVQWVLFGLVVGIATHNRLSTPWLVAALLVATLIERPFIWWPGPLLAGLASLAVLSPWILWQHQHDWPTIEFLRNATAHKLSPVPPIQFWLTQFAVLNVFALPIWLAGATVGWTKAEWRPYAGGFWTVALVLVLAGKSRENYLSPAYALVVPVGAIWWSERSEMLARIGAVIVWTTGLAMAFLYLPILPAKTLSEMLARLPQPPSSEVGPKSPLQGLSDTIGWPDLVADVAHSWQALPPETRRESWIVTFNYGEASAVRRFGAEFNLPVVVCGHNNFDLWSPSERPPRYLLFVGDWNEDILSPLGKISLLGTAGNPLAAPSEARCPIRLVELREPETLALRALIRRYE